MTANTLIYEIRRFVCKDIYLATLLFSIIHFVLLLGRPIFMEIKRGLNGGSSLISSFIYSLKYLAWFSVTMTVACSNFSTVAANLLGKRNSSALYIRMNTSPSGFLH